MSQAKEYALNIVASHTFTALHEAAIEQPLRFYAT